MHAVRAGIERLRGRLDAFDRRMAIALASGVLAIPVVFVLLVPHPLEQPVGVDYRLYRDATAGWLDGASFYPARQLGGPYDITAGDILYPPVAIWLFVPFAALRGPEASLAAAVAWWLIPLGATAIAVASLRPRAWTWPLLALCATNPTVLLKIWTGNPVIWSMAALSLAVALPWRATAPFVLLKPSLAPFALFGANRRSWWVGAAAFALLSLPFGAAWSDWVATLVNSRGGGILYSSLEAPFLLLPLAAWLGRTRGRPAGDPAPAGRLPRSDG
jgi:hypothetical protein